MYQRLLKRFRRQDGFTLIELIVVVAILGILAAVLTPRVLDAIDNAKKNGAEATGKSIQLAMERYYLKEGGYPTVEQMREADGGDGDTDLEYADLVALLSAYSSIDSSQFSVTTQTFYYSVSGSGYRMSVGLEDSGKSVDVTPGGVKINASAASAH